MSILTSEILHSGMIFGADRNVTFHPAVGKPYQEEEQKIFRWPNDNTLFGFVGIARLGGKPIGVWLKDIQTEFSFVTDLSKIADMLRYHIQQQVGIDGTFSEGMIVHLGGFKKHEDEYIPELWHIANVGGFNQFDYSHFVEEFYSVDAFNIEMKKNNVAKSEIRDWLQVRERSLDPFWFHQGIEYYAYNVFGGAAKIAYRYLCCNHPDFKPPTDLSEWESHVRFSILLYGSYYQAFYPLEKQYVGGCDVLSIEWPA